MPHSYPHSFGYAPSMDSVSGTSLALDLEHVARAKARLLTQFQGKPRLEAFVEALVRQVVHLEVAAWQLLVERLLSTAAGANLDAIGDIVGVSRSPGADDARHRRRIAVEVLVLRSRGTAGDVLGIAELYSGETDMRLDQRLPCEATLVLGFELDGASCFDLAKLVTRAKAAGHRITTEYLTQPAAESFSFSNVLSAWEPNNDATGFGWSGDAALGGQLAGVTE
jgi:hypothetical protein